MSFSYKTRGMSNPSGKPRLFFCCYPADFEKYFEQVSELILAKQNCAIWYDPANEGITEDNTLELQEMQLFVVPVTSNLLLSLNTAMDELIPFALEHHIPILPLMQESGLDQVYASRFGDIQYLDKNEQDATTLSFEEKVERYLSSVIVGDELARKVRAAFDAYIFLSYRKKDRKYANELMRLIHKNEFCRDIAIWYDEYLVPGENFNDAIAEALQKCDIFTLAVTPNMVNEVNYVMTTEYPEVRKTAKPILPAELVPTDQEQMKELYEGIPDCVDARDEVQLSTALLEALRGIAKMENDNDPQHNFFIGLAYLNGIDVEVDHERALFLITEAAEAGLDEAIEQLISMYRTGNGVERNYLTAIRWRERQVELWEERYQQSGEIEDEEALNTAVFHLSVDWSGIGRIDEAIEAAERAVQIREDLVEKYSDPDHYSAEELRLKREILCVDLSMLANHYTLKYNYEKVWETRARALEILQEMIDGLSEEETDVKQELEIMLAKEMLSCGGFLAISGNSEQLRKEQQQFLLRVIDIMEKYPQMEAAELRTLRIEAYSQWADICRKSGDIEDAIRYYGYVMELRRDEAEESGEANDSSIADIYWKVGDLSTEHGRYETAQEYYGKAIAIYEELLSENPIEITIRDGLGLCYFSQGKFFRACGEYDKAKESCVRAAELFRGLAEEAGTYEFRIFTENCTVELGHICLEAGKLQESAAYFQDALRQCAELSRIEELADVYRFSITMFECCDALWEICEATERTEEFAECCMPYLQVIEDDVTKWEAEGSRFDLGLLCNRMEEWEKAQENYFKAAGDIELDTEDPEKLRERIDCLERACYATEQMEEYYTAAVCYEEVLEDREKLVKLDPTVEERCGLIGTYRDIIASYAMADDAHEVMKYGEMAIDPARELAQETDDPEHRDLCGEITYYLVYVTEGEKRQQLWKECCGIYERLADEYPDSERYARLKEHVAGLPI